MNKLHTNRLRWTGTLAAGALAFGAVIGFADAAQAASISTYRITGAAATVLADATGTSTTVGTLTPGTAVTIDCAVRATSVHGNTVWHHITTPVDGFIADYYTNTPGFNQFLTGEAVCATTAPSAPVTTAPSTPVSTPPVTAPPVIAPPVTTAPVTTAPAASGQTITYNEGVRGSCVFYVMDRFHQLLGVYPKAFGDARLLATSAAKYGWTTSSTPRVNSVAIFLPGDNGAASTGHAAWVEQVSGTRIYIAEMNAPTAGVITHRWIDNPAASVRYIYTS